MLRTPTRIYVHVYWTFGILIATVSAGAADSASLSSALDTIQANELKQHVSVLASDAFEGRQAGARGGRAASIYLVEQLKKLKTTGGISGQYFQEFGTGLRNVIALLPGSDPVLKDEYIVIGAHYDHVGYGTSQNSFGPLGAIHNGADDNASGVSSLLEVIQAFTSLDIKPRRSLLFAFWDGEEDGLLGSAYFVANPPVPLQSIRLMLNVDMIGRLAHDKLEVYGARTGPGLRRFISEQNRGMQLDFHWEMVGDSDHYSFFQKNIPSLMLHTGKHDDYHRPSDDVDKLNLDGLQRVSRMLFGLVYQAAMRSELPAFRTASRRETQEEQIGIQPSGSNPIRLGISWDPELAKGGVVHITNVITGSPAEHAGLRVGDRVEQFAGQTVRDDSDFRTMVLVTANPAEIAVRRPGEDQLIETQLNLNGTPVRLGVSWGTFDAEPGCIVLANVVPFSPASRAGLKVGDRVLEVLHAPVATSEQFIEAVRQAKDQLDLLVERDGIIRTVPVLLWSANASAETEGNGSSE